MSLDVIVAHRSEYGRKRPAGESPGLSDCFLLCVGSVGPLIWCRTVSRHNGHASIGPQAILPPRRPVILPEFSSVPDRAPLHSLRLFARDLVTTGSSVTPYKLLTCMFFSISCFASLHLRTSIMCTVSRFDSDYHSIINLTSRNSPVPQSRDQVLGGACCRSSKSRYLGSGRP